MLSLQVVADSQIMLTIRMSDSHRLICKDLQHIDELESKEIYKL